LSSFRDFFFLIASLYILLTEQRTRVLFFVCLISQFFPTSISLLPKYRIYNTGGFRTGPLHQTSPANNSGFPPLGEPSNGVRHTGSISSLGSDNGSSSSGVNSKRRSPPNSDPYSNGNNSNRRRASSEVAGGARAFFFFFVYRGQNERRLESRWRSTEKFSSRAGPFEAARGGEQFIALGFPGILALLLPSPCL